MEYFLTKDELYHSSIQSQKYGVPEQKKFPLFDLDHVKSAIKFFNYVDPKYEDKLAKAILRRAKEYGLDLSEMSIGDNNRFKKYLPNDELKHHGILGQKWGIHRYQNEDGTYTEAGKKHRLKEYKNAYKNYYLNKKNKNGESKRSISSDLYKNANPERVKRAEDAAYKKRKEELKQLKTEQKIINRINKKLGRPRGSDEDTLPKDWTEYATKEELGSIYKHILKENRYKRIAEFESNMMAREFMRSLNDKKYDNTLISELGRDLQSFANINGGIKAENDFFEKNRFK